jgi:hypothetical protein
MLADPSTAKSCLSLKFWQWNDAGIHNMTCVGTPTPVPDNGTRETYCASESLP